MHAWRVAFTLPPDKEAEPPRTYTQNRTAIVLTESLSRATDLVLMRYSDCTIFTAAHQGEQEIIIDPTAA